MPLSELARRYADSLFAQSHNQINAEHKKDLEAFSATRNPPPGSGWILRNYIDLIIRRITLLAEARSSSLQKAYDADHLPFDEIALNEIKSEVVDFCQSQQHDIIGRLGTQPQSPLGIPSPQADQVLRNGIVGGVDALRNRLVRELDIRRYETRLADRRAQTVYASAAGKPWDVFISHASEDKTFVAPLAAALEASGLTTWYDTTALTVGDHLMPKIDEGLARSRFGIVVLSHNFFNKNWPMAELNGLMSKEIYGAKVILPVWHELSHDEVLRYSPILAGVVAAKSSDGIGAVVTQLRTGMGL